MADSHIQVTHALLNRFQNNIDKKVYYLDLSSNKISVMGSGRLGTEAGYYSKEHETYLNNEIESVFSKLCSDICSFFEEAKSEQEFNEILLRRDSDVICKRFFTGANSRSNLTMDSVQRNSYTAFLFDDQSNHDAITYLSIDKANGIFEDGINPIFKNCKMVVVHNRTNRQFVIPRNCFYYTCEKGYQVFFMPISPENAIELVPDNYKRPIVNGQESRLVYIDSPDDIAFLNERALKTEYAFNKCFIAAQDKRELEYLQGYLNKNRDELEEYRMWMNQ